MAMREIGPGSRHNLTLGADGCGVVIALSRFAGRAAAHLTQFDGALMSLKEMGGTKYVVSFAEAETGPRASWRGFFSVLLKINNRRT